MWKYNSDTKFSDEKNFPILYNLFIFIMLTIKKAKIRKTKNFSMVLSKFQKDRNMNNMRKMEDIII